jgi:curli biogenesis system outer membrane secretion channel CsgG
MKIQSLAVIVGVALVSAACGGSSSSAPPATTAAKPAGATSSLGTTAAGEFGVPECDSYMSKYKACLDSKVPDNVKPMLKTTLDQTAAAWRQAASTPQGKSALAQSCAQQETLAKQTLAPYGCSW